MCRSSALAGGADAWRPMKHFNDVPVRGFGCSPVCAWRQCWAGDQALWVVATSEFAWPPAPACMLRAGRIGLLLAGSQSCLSKGGEVLLP